MIKIGHGATRWISGPSDTVILRSMPCLRLKRLQVKGSVRKDLDNLPVQIKMEQVRFLKETKLTLHQLKERKIRGAKALRVGR